MNPQTGLDDVVMVVNTSIDEKKNTFNFADGTATQAFELPSQAGVSESWHDCHAYSVVCPRLATKTEGCQGVPDCPRVVKVDEVKPKRLRISLSRGHTSHATRAAFKWLKTIGSPKL